MKPTFKVRRIGLKMKGTKLTMMSNRVSLLTLKGIFLMTMAVGITSSSFP